MNYVLMPIAHGVEFKQVQQDYAQPLIESVKSKLNESERNFLIPLPYNYTVRTDPRQLLVYNAVEGGLGNQELRKFKHTIGSDVTWSFIVAKDGKDCFYTDFVNDVTNIIENARVKYPIHKVMCLGHSQGTQLFYSFFFDYHKTIDMFVSLGSPISMNSGAYPDFGKVPTILRGWANFYHKLDFISSRLQGCHPSNNISEFVVDYETPAGWNPVFWIPTSRFPKIRLVAGLLAHVSYWKSQFVADKIAEIVLALMHEPS